MRDANKKLIEATCPDCRGSLGEIRHDGGTPEFVCMIGHRYSAQALLAAHYEAQKRALWAAVVALEESANVASTAAPQFPEEAGTRLRAQGERRIQQAAGIRKVLEGLEPFTEK
jgi:two-component system, chemotaxis family, protein-glutamate methylesterase/glutaminase